ncbi:MAG: hypothetical protein E4H00_09740 [Myxococcales bacterium]|nr:MAG: hypothetical protein E4H00_09740 [Myxococcales bacterium]
MRKVVGWLVVAAAVTGMAAVAHADEPARPDFPVVVPQQAPAPVAAPTPVCCDKPAVNWTFGMSTSYTYDFNSPDSQPLSGVSNEATYASLEQDESFNIDLVQLGASGERGRLSYSAKIDYGDLARVAGDSSDGDIALQTAVISFDFNDGIIGSAGRFDTPIGYEVLEPWGNGNISRSWTWIGQPINHDGIKVDAGVDMLDFGVGVVNRFTVADQDILANDNDDEKGVFVNGGAAISDALNLYVAGLWNEDDDTNHQWLVDGIISGDVAVGDDDSVNYALEAMWRRNDDDNTGTDDVWSVAAYVGFGLGPVSMRLRGEYMDDQGVIIGNNDVWSITATGGVELVDGVEFRVEYRHDDADNDMFLDDSHGDDTIDVIQAQLVWAP